MGLEKYEKSLKKYEKKGSTYENIQTLVSFKVQRFRRIFRRQVVTVEFEFDVADWGVDVFGKLVQKVLDPLFGQ